MKRPSLRRSLRRLLLQAALEAQARARAANHVRQRRPGTRLWQDVADQILDDHDEYLSAGEIFFVKDVRRLDRPLTDRQAMWLRGLAQRFGLALWPGCPPGEGSRLPPWQIARLTHAVGRPGSPYSGPDVEPHLDPAKYRRPPRSLVLAAPVEQTQAILSRAERALAGRKDNPLPPRAATRADL